MAVDNLVRGGGVLMRIAVVAAAICFSIVGLATADDAKAVMRKTVEISAEALGPALTTLARDFDFQVLYRTEVVGKLRTQGVSGAVTAPEALERVLSGTGLTYRYLDEKTVTIVPAASTRSQVEGSGGTSSTDQEGKKDSFDGFLVAQVDQGQTSGPSTVEKQHEQKKQADELQEVVVTGTHIRGEVPAGSELKVYGREDIEQSGAATVDQFARLMPQNFSNNDSIANFGSPIGGLAPFSGGGNNITGGGAFNLHGLGPTATLTLLNGHRVASAGSDGSLIDVSQIPLSAVDHIEVLSDGASAIYGADAVAGVVNIVTRKDFDGAETGVRYGGATDGGAHEVMASQLLGHSWDTGNALLTYEYDKQGGLDASQRSYIPSQGGPFSLAPSNRRNSVLLTGSQALGAGLTISAEAIYSDRVTSYDTTFASPSSLTNAFSADEKQSGIALTVDYRLLGDWHVSLTGNYSKVLQDWSQIELPSGAAESLFQTLDTDSQLREVDALATGSLLPIPGGPVKAALGGSFRTEQFGESNFVEPSTNDSIPTAQRHVSSVYGEIAIPITVESNGIPGARRLDLSAAVRYDDYSDAGSTTNYKLGAAWEPVAGFTVKSTFGTSFQAALLSQLHQLVFSYAFAFPDAVSSTGTTDTLFQGGGNPNLQPEKSRSFTVGFDVKPAEHPNFQFSANYFHINFDNRIESPPLIGNNLFTSLLAPFITRNPPLAVVEAAFNSPGFLFDFGGPNFTPGGPAAVKAIFDDRIANIATTKESGVDLSTGYRLPTAHGQFGASLDLTYLLRNDFQSLTGVPAFALLNIVGEPTRWKGRAGISWTEGSLSASAFVNFVNAYENNLLTPAQTISSWTTGDVHVAYKTPSSCASLPRDLTVALTISNITDRRPPYVALPAGQPPIPFDSANASPIGRLVTLQVIKGWKFH